MKLLSFLMGSYIGCKSLFSNICNMNFSRLQNAADLNEALLALIFDFVPPCVALTITSHGYVWVS